MALAFPPNATESVPLAEACPPRETESPPVELAELPIAIEPELLAVPAPIAIELLPLAVAL